MITFAESDNPGLLRDAMQWTRVMSSDATVCSLRSEGSAHAVSDNYSPRESVRQQVFDDLISQIESCTTPGWDGYDALPVDLGSVRFAIRVIFELEDWFPMPSIGIDPDGEITLEWTRNELNSVSVSVSSHGLLHYAAILDGKISHGKIEYAGFSSLREVKRSVFEAFAH